MVKIDCLILVLLGLVFSSLEGRKARILEGSSHKLQKTQCIYKRIWRGWRWKNTQHKSISEGSKSTEQICIRWWSSTNYSCWFTGSFNLTSHFTLFLHKDTVLLASQEINQWPLIDPLTILWSWEGCTRRQVLTSQISSSQISNLTLVNSPSWTIHPVYSSNIIIEGITFLAPVTSPNTDGIDPDSCTNIRLEDNYIVSGDDRVAVKSGWDEYGIKYGRPTSHLIIRRLTCISPSSAAIALGSKMSGGIQDVRVQDITAINTESGIRIKTGIGRCSFVKDVYVKGMKLHTMKWVFWMTDNYGSHADTHWDPKALPEIKGINYRDVVAENVSMAGQLDGISGDPFTRICMSNVTIGLAKKSKKYPWACTNIEGISSSVQPPPCQLLADQGPKKSGMSDFPTESLRIEMQRCYRLNY